MDHFTVKEILERKYVVKVKTELDVRRKFEEQRKARDKFYKDTLRESFNKWLENSEPFLIIEFTIPAWIMEHCLGRLTLYNEIVITVKNMLQGMRAGQRRISFEKVDLDSVNSSDGGETLKCSVHVGVE
jgi:hypothetical protein